MAGYAQFFFHVLIGYDWEMRYHVSCLLLKRFDVNTSPLKGTISYAGQKNEKVKFQLHLKDNTKLELP